MAIVLHAIEPPIPKRRTLFVGRGAAEAQRACLRHLRRMVGIISAIGDEGSLTVEYDLRRISLAQIEALAAMDGMAFKAGLHRIRRALWKFAERIELEHAVRAGNGACCSRPPAARGGR